ncbi:MAG: glycosyltransferase family 2 protein [Bacteroidota bacterium]
MPKLSIITINYNNLQGLKQTIESVVNQTSSDFEYIVIDGASSDGSKELIESYQDNISYWVSEPDKGIYNAMNKGILASKGEYCQFLNSGDYLVNKDVIKNMLAKLDSSSIFYGNLIKVFAGGKSRRETEMDCQSLYSFYKGSLNHASVFIKKTLFDTYGLYDEKLKIVSDWKFFLEVLGLNNESVKYVNIDVTYFDMSGISSSNRKLEQEERRQVFVEKLPQTILNDFDKNKRAIEMFNRLRKNRLIFALVFLMERMLFKIEKLKNKFN